MMRQHRRGTAKDVWSVIVYFVNMVGSRVQTRRDGPDKTSRPVVVLHVHHAVLSGYTF